MTFLKSFFGDLFESKKFKGALLMVLFVILAAGLKKLGVELDEKTFWAVLGSLGVFPVTQGVADFGKEAAKIAGAVPKATVTKTQ